MNKAMEKQNSLRKKQQGFTLLEIMVVVVIIGILLAVVAPNIMDKPEQARMTKAQFDIRALESALDSYRLDMGTYPSTDGGLEALTSKPSNAPRWKEGGYIKSLPKDPWGNAYQYLNPGVHGSVDIFSLGADGQQGGDGSNSDIGNWNTEG
jgi:general secretion pathway protein G